MDSGARVSRSRLDVAIGKDGRCNGKCASKGRRWDYASNGGRGGVGTKESECVSTQCEYA
jgi:hypothetical protein